MQITQTGFEGLVEIQPPVFNDERGWFFEFYKEDVFRQHGLPAFVQENQSYSKKNVIRGLHFQLPPYAQGKLVTVIHGKVLDVAVDLRKDSPTFLKVYYCLLDGKKHNMLMVPEGFAHGFAALEDSIFHYKCTNVYDRPSESGIAWNDPDLKIDWTIENPIISVKDQKLPTLNELFKKSVISQH